MQATTLIVAQMRFEEPSNLSLALAAPDANIMMQTSTAVLNPLILYFIIYSFLLLSGYIALPKCDNCIKAQTRP
jgi:hypothetical protein